LLGEKPEALTEAYQCRNEAYKNLMTECSQTIQAQRLDIDPIDYTVLNQTFAEIGINGLNNGLSVEDNQRLFETQNQEEAIGLILAGLTRIRNQEK